MTGNYNTKDVLIHIGYHKTASTWLQNELFIDESSVFRPISKKAKGVASLANLFFKSSDGHILSSFDDNTEEIERERQTIFQKKSFKNKIAVLSHERLSGNPHSGGFDSKIIANRLKNVFPDAKILIVIREQKSFILSNYMQYLSIGGYKSISEYLQTDYDGKIPFFSAEHIRYYPLIQYYQQLFGTEKVLVLPYEMFKLTPEAFVEKLSQFVGKSIMFDVNMFLKKLNESSDEYWLRYRFRSLFSCLKSTSVNDYKKTSRFKKWLVKRTLEVMRTLSTKKADLETRKLLELQIEEWCGDR